MAYKYVAAVPDITFIGYPTGGHSAAQNNAAEFAPQVVKFLNRRILEDRGWRMMSEAYIPQEIELKWQKKWDETGLYRQVIDEAQPKYYAMTMLPYPSGDLHIGHWYAMSPSDARARYMRMKGYNVLFPMGFDTFGLPAENAAIKNEHPSQNWTYANIERMRGQLSSMGAMFDWEREAVSADPVLL